MNFNQEINNYTEKGRSIIHQKVYNIQWMVEQLLKNKQYDQSVEYNDNRISLFVGQKGKCHVTGNYLTLDAMECHHKLPKSQGGTDDYKNLVWLCTDAHKLIHSTTKETIEKYLMQLNLDSKGLKRVNSLRQLVGNLEI